MKSVRPSKRNSPTSGLRLAVNAGLAGSMRPGLTVSSGPPPAVTLTAVVERAAGPVDEAQAAVGAEQEARPDVAARRAAVLVVDRVDLAELVGRATCRLDRHDQLPHTSGLAATMPPLAGAVVVLDLLDGDEVGRLEVVR